QAGWALVPDGLQAEDGGADDLDRLVEVADGAADACLGGGVLDEAAGAFEGHGGGGQALDGQGGEVPGGAGGGVGDDDAFGVLAAFGQFEDDGRSAGEVGQESLGLRVVELAAGVPSGDDDAPDVVGAADRDQQSRSDPPDRGQPRLGAGVADHVGGG